MDASAYTYLLGFALVAAPKEGVLWLYHAKPSRGFGCCLRVNVGVMEQASGRFMTGIRTFSAHLPLTFLLWLSITDAALRFLVY